MEPIHEIGSVEAGFGEAPLIEGVRVTIHRRKTDQEAKGQTIVVLRGAGPFCPGAAVAGMAGRSWGALFRQVPKGSKRIGGRLGGRAYYDVIKSGNRRHRARGVEIP
jgi:hypothetical protein